MLKKAVIAFALALLGFMLGWFIIGLGSAFPLLFFITLPLGLIFMFVYFILYLPVISQYLVNNISLKEALQWVKSNWKKAILGFLLYSIVAFLTFALMGFIQSILAYLLYFIENDWLVLAIFFIMASVYGAWIGILFYTVMTVFPLLGKGLNVKQTLLSLWRGFKKHLLEVLLPSMLGSIIGVIFLVIISIQSIILLSQENFDEFTKGLESFGLWLLGLVVYAIALFIFYYAHYANVALKSITEQTNT